MEGWEWMNPPASFEFTGPNSVKMVTKDHTDFWQRTQHEFRNDNGHFLFKRVKGDFTISADCHFQTSPFTITLGSTCAWTRTTG